MLVRAARATLLLQFVSGGVQLSPDVDELWVHGKSWRPTRDRAKVVRNETCRGSDLRLYKVRDEKGNSLF